MWILVLKTENCRHEIKQRKNYMIKKVNIDVKVWTFNNEDKINLNDNERVSVQICSSATN